MLCRTFLKNVAVIAVARGGNRATHSCWVVKISAPATAQQTCSQCAEFDWCPPRGALPSSWLPNYPGCGPHNLGPTVPLPSSRTDIRARTKSRTSSQSHRLKASCLLGSALSWQCSKLAVLETFPECPSCSCVTPVLEDSKHSEPSINHLGRVTQFLGPQRIRKPKEICWNLETYFSHFLQSLINIALVLFP